MLVTISSRVISIAKLVSRRHANHGQGVSTDSELRPTIRTFADTRKKTHANLVVEPRTYISVPAPSPVLGEIALTRRGLERCSDNTSISPVSDPAPPLLDIAKSRV